LLRLTDDQGKAVVRTIAVAVGNPLTPRVWYTFDETSGTVAHDSSGHGFDGTMPDSTGTWITNGNSHGALDFNNVTRLSIPDGVFETIDQQMTMSVGVHTMRRTDTQTRLYSAS
jgi:hypothetical protein